VSDRIRNTTSTDIDGIHDIPGRAPLRQLLAYLLKRGMTTTGKMVIMKTEKAHVTAHT